MVWRRLFGGFEPTLAALVLAACASSGFDGHVYQDGDVRFRVGPVPSAWRRLEVEDARLAFRDDSANATVAVNGRCGLDGDDVPLRTEISAALDGVKKQYLVYVLKKNSCVYDFMYIAADSAPGSRADFERFVQGFAALE